MRDRLNPDVATSEGFHPVAGPYRPDSETCELTDALNQLRGANIRLVVEKAKADLEFVGISIWRHKKECKL